MKFAKVFVLAMLTALPIAAAPATRPAAPATRPAADRGSTAAAPAIAAPAATPQRFVHRITGLFSPDREADLRIALEKLPGIDLVSLDFDHAEATFSYDPAKAFAGTKPDKIIERFNQELGNASNHTMGVKPLYATPREQLQRVEIPVVGLDCKACCLAAYELMAKQDGVAQATASFKEGRLTALIDPTKTTDTKLKAVLKERGVTLATPQPVAP